MKSVNSFKNRRPIVRQRERINEEERAQQIAQYMRLIMEQERQRILSQLPDLSNVIFISQKGRIFQVDIMKGRRTGIMSDIDIENALFICEGSPEHIGFMQRYGLNVF